MSNLNTDRQLEYNSEPVYYCKHCLSLRIRHVASMEDSEYCDECGCTDIQKTNIGEWEKLYKNKFGHKLLDTY